MSKVTHAPPNAKFMAMHALDILLSLSDDPLQTIAVEPAGLLMPKIKGPVNQEIPTWVLTNYAEDCNHSYLQMPSAG